jgi:hypothetical protein
LVVKNRQDWVRLLLSVSRRETSTPPHPRAAHLKKIEDAPFLQYLGPVVHKSMQTLTSPTHSHFRRKPKEFPPPTSAASPGLLLARTPSAAPRAPCPPLLPGPSQMPAPPCPQGPPRYLRRLPRHHPTPALPPPGLFPTPAPPSLVRPRSPRRHLTGPPRRSLRRP